MFGTNMQLQAFVLTLQKSAFLWGSGTSVLSDVEVKDSSKTRPGFTDLFIEILVSLRSTIIDCMCYYTAVTSEKQSNVKYLPIISL